MLAPCKAGASSRTPKSIIVRNGYLIVSKRLDLLSKQRVSLTLEPTRRAVEIEFCIRDKAMFDRVVMDIVETWVITFLVGDTAVPVLEPYSSPRGILQPIHLASREGMNTLNDLSQKRFSFR